MTKKKDEKKVLNLDTVMQAKNKNCGKNTMMTGDKIIYNPARIPFGIFPLDLMTGGGIPLWGSTCLWGGKGGGKTTLVIKLVKVCKSICWKCFNPLPYCTCSKKSLILKPVVVDIEGTLDLPWMEANDVNRDDYYLVYGDFEEESFDVAESCLCADDCGLLAIDSLGGSVTEAEMDKSLSDPNMGKDPYLITRVVKKLKKRLIREKKRLHPCTIVYVNQMRADLQKKFGSKESMSGGYASIHEYSLVLRCVNKALNESDKKKFIDEDRGMKRVSRHAITVKHTKVFTAAGACEFLLSKENIPTFNLNKGDVDDIDVLIKYGRTVGVVYQEKSKWKLLNFDDVKFNTLEELKLYLKDFAIHTKVGSMIIQKMKDRLEGTK